MYIVLFAVMGALLLKKEQHESRGRNQRLAGQPGDRSSNRELTGHCVGKCLAMARMLTCPIHLPRAPGRVLKNLALPLRCAAASTLSYEPR